MGEASLVPPAREELSVTPRVAWLRSQDPDADPALPLGARRGVRRDLGGGDMCWDLGAPGLDGVTTTAAAQGLFAAFILPLSIVGVATLTWSDWPGPLSLLLGLVGLAGCAFSALLVVWPFIFAAAWRERIHLSAGQILVIRGVWPFRRTHALGHAAGVTVRDVPRDEGLLTGLLAPNRLGGPGAYQLELKPPDGRPVRVGTWLDDRIARRLRDRLRAVIAAGTDAAGAPHSPPPPLGWTGPRLGHAIARAWHRFRADPAPTLFDVALFLGMGLAASLPDTHTFLKHAYGPLAVIALLSFAVLAASPRRVAGLTDAARGVLKLPFLSAISFFALVTGAAAGPMTLSALTGIAPRLDLTLLIVGLVVSASLAVLAGRRAFGTAEGRPRRAIPRLAWNATSVVFFLSLVGVTWVHEGWAWDFVTDSRRGLGPISIAMLPVVAALLVWPARFLFTLAHPFEDGPRWAFIWILFGFALFSLAGLHV